MSAREITVREACECDGTAWNDFLDTIPESSPLARYEWRRVLEAAYGVPTRFLVAERGRRIVGVLGGYEVRNWLGARRFYSLRCGLVAPEQEVAGALLAQVESLAVAHRWSDVLVTSGTVPLVGLQTNAIKKTLQLTLDEDEARMWASLRAKTRNMIRRAERAGLVVAAGAHYVGALYEHYIANMLRLRVTPHSRAFFEETVRAFGPSVDVLVALHNGEPVASMLICYGRDTACYPYQNVRLEYRKSAAIQLLNWEAMRRAAAHGARVLDMGESREDSPVFRSKVNFGGVPRDVYYYAPMADMKEFDPSPDGWRLLARLAAITDTLVTRHGPAALRRRTARIQLLRKRLL